MATASHAILVSEALIAELAEVLGRPKFVSYFSPDDARQFLEGLRKIADVIPVLDIPSVCRDPKDDAILALAVSGAADLIVT
jgi:putative PIN family toxin of toxin-antitoxin system